MRKLRSFMIVGALAGSMMLATSARADAFVCIDNSVYCCGTVTINGKQITIIPINC